MRCLLRAAPALLLCLVAFAAFAQRTPSVNTLIPTNVIGTSPIMVYAGNSGTSPVGGGGTLFIFNPAASGGNNIGCEFGSLTGGAPSFNLNDGSSWYFPPGQWFSWNELPRLPLYCKASAASTPITVNTEVK